MSGIVTYSHLSAKLHAMKGKMLSVEDYKQLMNKSNVTEIAVYLRDQTYYSSAFKELQDVEIHRGYLEILLYRAQMMEALKVGKYLKGKDKDIYRYVYRRQEIEDLKKMLRVLQMGKSLETIDRKTLFISRYSKIDFHYSLRAKNVVELIDSLKTTKFYYILKPLLGKDESIDMYDAEMALDMYYYTKLVEQIKSNAGNADRDILLSVFGTDADMKNILWLYRAKKYYKVNKEMLYRYMIPLSYKLKKEEINSLIEAKDVEELVSLVKGTYYRQFIGDDPSKWEKELMERTIHIQKKNVQTFPYSIAPIVGYIAMKELEIRNVIMIIEGVRYKVSPDMLEQQIIQ